MAAAPAVRAKLAAAGMGVLAPVDGLRALAAGVTVGTAPGVFAAAVLDAPRLVTATRRRWPFYGEVGGERGGGGPPVAVAPAAAPPATAPSPPSSRSSPAYHTAWALRLATAAASRAAGRTVAPDEPLAAAGVDSLGAVALRGELSDATGLDLPATLAFDYPTVGELGRAVSGMMMEKEGRGRAAAAPPAAPAATVATAATAPSLPSPPLFYTHPSLTALARLPATTLASLPRFVAGRAGVGEIVWLKPVDVRGLDVASAVALERGRVAVTPGTGLARAPALVTFYGMMAPAGGEAAYEARLRRATERAGWGWVGWEEGEWVVRVGGWGG
jgi:hypothetical protein